MSEWTAIDECGPGVWAAETTTGSGWHLRCVAVSLADGSLAIYSPLRKLGNAAHQSLAELGKPALLVAPNHFHYLGLREYLDRHGPDCRTVCSEVASPRIAARSRCQLHPLSALTERLPEHIEVLEPPGLKTGEVWLRIRTGEGMAWVVSDAFFTLARVPRGAMGWFCRLTGTAPGIRIGRTFTTLAVARGGAYRDWLVQAIDRDRPAILIPSHGEIISDAELPSRLRELARQRLF